MGNYPEEIVAPMRAELVQAGFRQLMDASDVDSALRRPGLSLLVVNSVCGCAAAGARPGVIEALGRGLKFDQLLTVFAGMEKDATQQAREYFEGAMPTSPQAAILKDGQLVQLMQRHEFLDRHPVEIADRLQSAYEKAMATS